MHRVSGLLHSVAVEIHLIPISWLRRAGVPETALLHVSVLVSTMLTLLLIPLLRFVPHVCLAEWLFHVPCPGCGVTTGLLAIAKLDVAGSCRANPAALLVAALLIFQLLARPVALLRPRVGATVAAVSRRLSQVVVLTLFAVWIARVI